MNPHELAGKQVPPEMRINVPRLVSAYYTDHPDPEHPTQRVSFGTSGHRGTSLERSFNEDHVLAMCQAISQMRKAIGATGPLYAGMDTHALSEPALRTAIEVFAANHVRLFIQEDFGYTPTPVISHAILTHNRGRSKGLADGVVITPSHNPPSDGGFKYNPPHGGPASPETTKQIEDHANQILEDGLRAVKRTPLSRALTSDTVHSYDYVTPYVDDLRHALNLDPVRESGLSIGVDPMGGSGLAYWAPIAEKYGLNLEVVNRQVDPTFSFMTLDHDGQIRMDPSSKHAMASLLTMRDDFDVSFGNDPDFDRHGIVTRTGGLMNPNHYLAVAVWYLFQHRPAWGEDLAVGKTLVSSSMIDRVAAHLERDVCEVPVGFKWFVDGLVEGWLGFAGEESAGASFLRRDESVWTTDKDGILLDLLAAEIMATTGQDPHEHYRELQADFGDPAYQRVVKPATQAQKKALKDLSPRMVKRDTLAGEPIVAKLTRAPCNDAPIGGLKVVTENGWFAARPSGTEDVYKIYAESFCGPHHLESIQAEAQEIVTAAFEAAGADSV